MVRIASRIAVEVGPSVPIPSLEEGARSPFARHLRVLRHRFGRKQLWLAHAAGYTDAAVSLWESGKRIPGGKALCRIVQALTQAGASTVEIADLLLGWREAVSRREAAREGSSQTAVNTRWHRRQ